MKFAFSIKYFKSAFFPFLVLIILSAGAWIRIAHFPDIPPGLNQDEASSAYESWSIATTGADRWGNVLPAYFPALGSGQNTLLAYLTVPAVRLLGLNIFSARIVSLILGLLLLPLLLFSLWPAKRPIALLATLVVALVPWHFMLSRWALESNLLPFFMLLGCALMIRGVITGKRRWIVPSLLPIALALYAYGTTVAMLAPFFLLFIILHFKAIRDHLWSWLSAFGLFCVLGFPFFLYFFEQYVIGRNMAWTDDLFFSTPLCVSSRLSEVSGTGILWGNIEFLMRGFDDGGNYNLMHGYLLLFPFCSLLGFLGLGLFSVQLARKKIAHQSLTKEMTAVSIFAIWGLSSLSFLFLFQLNVNRFNHFYLPCIVLSIWLLDLLIQNVKSNKRRWALYGLTFAFLTFSTLRGIRYYFNGYRESDIKTNFYSGLGDAFEAVKGIQASQVHISPNVMLSYVYTLFYLKYPATQFRQEVNYEEKNGAYKVNTIGRYVFDDNYLNPLQPWGFLSKKGELQSSTKFTKEIVYQDNYWEVGVMNLK